MDDIQRITKNTALMLFSQIAGFVLGFIYIMYTARYLGAEGYGTLSLALAYSGLFGIFTDLGLCMLMTRDVARDRSLAGKYLGNIIIAKLILACFTFGLIIIAANLANYPEKTTEVLYIISISFIIGSFVTIFNSLFQAFEKMEYILICNIFNSVIMLIGALYGIYREFDILWFAYLYVITNIIALLFAFIVFLIIFAKPKINLDKNFLISIMKEALPFGLSSIFITIYYYISTIMLSLFIADSNEAVGWYNAAFRFTTIMLFIPNAFFLSIFPIMSRFFKDSDDSLKFVFERSLKYMIIISIPIGFGISLLADKIILLIYGQDFAPAAMSLRILIWSTVCIFMGSPFWYLLNSTNKQMIGTKITAIGAILNIILNLLFIPKFSYIAASGTTVFTEFMILIIEFYIISHTMYKPSRLLAVTLQKAFCASTLMMIFIITFFNINLVLLILVSAVLYMLCFYLIGGFDKADFNLIRAAVKNRYL